MDIQKFINDYLLWLKREITYDKIGEYYEINAPFLDSDNDYIQFYVKQEGQLIFFTDDGYTINSLESRGLTLSLDRRKKLELILKQFGVSLQGKELVMKASADEFSEHKHAFLQCILHVNDMYMLANSKRISIFADEVKAFFDEKEIYCTDDVQFSGKSGLIHHYDFCIQRSKTKPERLCVALNDPSKSAMMNTLFIWEDTKPYRKTGTQLITLINDSHTISKGVEEAFSNYDVQTLKWSERNSKGFYELLSA